MWADLDQNWPHVDQVWATRGGGTAILNDQTGTVSEQRSLLNGGPSAHSPPALWWPLAPSVHLPPPPPPPRARARAYIGGDL